MHLTRDSVSSSVPRVSPVVTRGALVSRLVRTLPPLLLLSVVVVPGCARVVFSFLSPPPRPGSPGWGVVSLASCLCCCEFGR